jgi:hypothetical protein
MRPLFAMALLAVPAIAAFPNGYSSCKVVTTQHAMVSGANDLTNYPLTVILTDADLRTTGNGGLVNNANGYDIGFYADCSGSGAALKWEMESYSPTTGAIVAHVLRPTLSHTTNDTIGMFYGGMFSSFQSTASAVWNANYKGIWHMAGATSLTDSTGVNNLTAGGGAPNLVAGKVGGCADFTSSGGWYYNTPATGISITGQITVSAWLVSNAPADSHPIYFGDDAAMLNLGISFDTSGRAWTYWNGGIYAATAGGGWNWYTFVYDLTAKSVTFYVNGALDSTHTGLPTFGTINPVVGIGAYANGTSHFPGAIDEVRISAVAESADWILTEYRNQSAPGTYISAGPRVAAGAGTRVRHLVTGGL